MIRILIILSLFSLNVSAQNNSTGIPIITKITTNGDRLVRGGIIFGMTSSPLNNKYTLLIDNASSYDQSDYRMLMCTVHLAENAVDILKPVELETVYYKEDGSLNISNGQTIVISQYPIPDYIILITNNKYVKNWNTLKCSMK